MATEGEERLSSEIENQDETDLVKQLDLQLEELDDDEFQLPPVAQLPTLESILNENESGSVSDDEFSLAPPTQPKTSFSNECGDTLSIHSRGSSDSRSHTSSEKQMARHRRETHSKSHGSILRHVILKGVSAQLVSAYERVGAGLPTAMAVSNVICVGTSHGLVLVFEPTQALKWCLGSTQIGEQYGSVSALALNQDCSRLLVGFAKGQICHYDLTTGKLLQTISDAHTPYSAVLHLKWTDYPGLAIISDSGGSVFELAVKRTMGMNSNESLCIFSGSRGEVCVVEPLLMSQFHVTPTGDTVIVAMATISKVIVVSLKPHLRVLFSHPLKCDQKTLPLLAWQFVIIQTRNGNRVIDPVLAFGREDSVYFYQLTHGSMEELQFIPLQKMVVHYHLQALAWLNSRTLAVMDTREQLHVIDVKTQEELETVDLAHLGLVYASPHFKAIATGGNVSKAMALAGEHACYHSMVSFGSQVLLLGTKSFQVVTMRAWTDRLEHLVKGGHLKEALQLALDIYQDKAHAVVGLTHKREKRKELIQEKITELLNKYLSYSVESCPDRSNLPALSQHYSQVVPHCIHVTIGADLTDLLFSRVWETFSDDAISRGIFLESLEPFLLNDQLPDISPSITQYFISHYEATNRLQAVQACIVHLNVTSLDIHQAMTLCWNHGLYDAIFYMYNQGMMDYVTPLEELVTELQSALSTNASLTDTQVTLGNKILVYISCCLAGRAYPHGNIASEQLRQVKHEVFKCITSLHSKNAKDSEQAYPVLRTLLKFDTREFLNVLALAFEEEEFTTELGMRQRQRVVDILLQVMVNGDEFGPMQLGCLFTFIARQMSKQQGAIAVNRQLFEQVLAHLTDTSTESHHEERQTALLELLQEGGIAHYDMDHLLECAQKAGFYRVCEFVYEKTGEHEMIVECYLADKLRQQQVFQYIRMVLTSPQYTDLHVQKVQEQFLAHIEILLEIDSNKTAQLLLTTQLSSLLSAIVERLKNEPKTLYTALNAIFLFRENDVSSSCAQDLPPLESDLQEEYINLMCQYHPSQVTAYLKSSEGYRLEPVLEICQKHDLKDATAYLLEKAGNIHGAFDILLSVLKDKIQNLMAKIENGSDGDSSLLLTQAKAQVLNIVRVCQLGSSQLEESGRRELWFPLLDTLLAAQPPLENHPHLYKELRGMVSHVVNSVMSHISLPAILERIMQDPSYCHGSFAQIKHLLQGMVERYIYEETLYSTVVRIIRGDQLRYLTSQRSHASGPLVIHNTSCSLCHGRFQHTSKAAVHSCGHTYHIECGGQGPQCFICEGGTDVQPGSDSTDPEGSKENEQDKEEAAASSPVVLPSLKNSPSAASQDEFDPLSHQFALRLAPPSITIDLDDV
ncbi:vacuolar protein sorting 8 [Oratosquilla oratoria]|uniref:vacuolar protein sorting 8 n=1 Tax=Oratosquilla oratoria TaxID=337810 RepID=UPI003F75DE26